MLGAGLEPYFAAFRALVRERPGVERERRTAAMSRFARLGLPTRRDEAWRFTNLRPLTAKPRLPAWPASVGPLDITASRMASPCHRLVFANGGFRPELSDLAGLPDGVYLGSLAAAREARPDLAASAFDVGDTEGSQPFASLNAGLHRDGYVVALPPGAALDRPVHVLHVAAAPEAESYHLRNLVVAGEGSSAQLLESFVGKGESWTNTVTQLSIGAGARVAHARIEAEAPDAVHLALIRCAVSTGAEYDSFTLSRGALLSRHDIQIAAQARARLGVSGAYLLRGRQEATITPVVDHLEPGTTTREVFKGVLEDEAHAAFLGTMIVRAGADGTEAHQLSRTLLTSRRASIDAKPELTIHADDVKCSHGATVGDLDETSLFYLASRGIAPETARFMLMQAFVADVIDGARLPAPLTAELGRQVDAWLEAGGMRR